eukprot:GILJ01031424.1.p1 GENE.GILJ01031424.1~~GILJ01031424.1.p1  ORF type:complete len:219 (+),score=29.46 GILJ01031424.1:222-878(+)
MVGDFAELISSELSAIWISNNCGTNVTSGYSIRGVSIQSGTEGSLSIIAIESSKFSASNNTVLNSDASRNTYAFYCNAPSKGGIVSAESSSVVEIVGNSISSTEIGAAASAVYLSAPAGGLPFSVTAAHHSTIKMSDNLLSNLRVNDYGITMLWLSDESLSGATTNGSAILLDRNNALNISGNVKGTYLYSTGNISLSTIGTGSVISLSENALCRIIF